ncbi:MAG: biotin--[acetyl-CoA-carboxylase] ligase [Legionella sp.]|uniref:biotin--[acetyl-CoA-carboxylase] ligase n=1 Tax=Legionella sp. TaxID=459 RepID=UPI0039E604D8
MMRFTSSQTTLLNILNDGCCHSGSELGQALGVTRSAIWKQINQLIELGIPIQSIPQQGYHLPQKLILLNEERLSMLLAMQKISLPVNVHVFSSIDSTNRFLKDLSASHELELCCAEMQTQGRGRFGRQWHSPFGENIYCSSRWNLNCDLAKLSSLSLITSLAILATLNELQVSSEIKIKWPNDIYWQDKKLCGSLIEIQAESNSNAQVIIGIGINVNTDTASNPLPDKPWCSLYEISQHYFDRTLLIASLVSHLDRYITKFIAHDLNAFIDEWNQVDYLAGKHIQITQSTKTIVGHARGINHWGQLILEDEKGQKHFLSSGDTSLQANQV